MQLAVLLADSAWIGSLVLWGCIGVYTSWTSGPYSNGVFANTFTERLSRRKRESHSLWVFRLGDTYFSWKDKKSGYSIIRDLKLGILYFSVYFYGLHLKKRLFFFNHIRDPAAGIQRSVGKTGCFSGCCSKCVGCLLYMFVSPRMNKMPVECKWDKKKIKFKLVFCAN